MGQVMGSLNVSMALVTLAFKTVQLKLFYLNFQVTVFELMKFILQRRNLHCIETVSKRKIKKIILMVYVLLCFQSCRATSAVAVES